MISKSCKIAFQELGESGEAVNYLNLMFLFMHFLNQELFCFKASNSEGLCSKVIVWNQNINFCLCYNLELIITVIVSIFLHVVNKAFDSLDFQVL